MKDVPMGSVIPNKRPTNRRRWDAIIDRLPKDRQIIGVEIGVLNGSTAKKILETLPLVTHIMVDPWEVPDSNSSYAKSGDENSLKPQKDHDEAYERVVAISSRHPDNSIIHRMYSSEAVELYDDKSLDYVFIDGDHSYEGVRNDIEIWIDKVKPGGWIGGHDYDHPRLPGVKMAVDEAFMKEDIELDDNRTWFVRL